MTSTSDRAYVWTWLPGADEPVVAGRLDRRGNSLVFGYARSYLERADAVSLGPELPLGSGVIPLRDGLTMPSCLRDGAPDSWGRRVILDQVVHRRGRGADVDELDELTYLMHSDSDRFGANDFQESPDRYVSRGTSSTLADLLTAADTLENGGDVPPALQPALMQGTSIGGARPKAVLRDENGDGWLAKFSSSTDVQPVIKAEIAGNILARRAGLDVPAMRVEIVLNRTVILTRRFDRQPGGLRRHTLSGLTLTGLDEMHGRYATYPDIFDAMKGYSPTPRKAGEDLFGRIAFNIAIGNTDDHARNIAVLWNGSEMEWTPAYDLTPTVRSGRTANQAMPYGREGQRASSLSELIGCSHAYGMATRQARDIVHGMVESIRSHWDEAADVAGLSSSERERLAGSSHAGRAILNDAALEGLR